MCTCIYVPDSAVHTVSCFIFLLAFIFNVSAAIFLKKGKKRKASEETPQKRQMHIRNEKSHKRAPLIVEISDVQDSFKRSELPVSLCGGFPQGKFPLFWMEEAYGRVHPACSVLFLFWVFVFVADDSSSGACSLSLQPHGSAAPGP